MKITIEYEGKPFRPYGPAFKAIRQIKAVDIVRRPGELGVSLTRADLAQLLDKLATHLEWADGRVRLIEPEEMS